jgi:hypothetical protein
MRRFDPNGFSQIFNQITKQQRFPAAGQQKWARNHMLAPITRRKRHAAGAFLSICMLASVRRRAAYVRMQKRGSEPY